MGAYTLKLDDTGGKLFITFNGTFMEYEPENIGLERFALSGIMLMNNPESERLE